MFGFSRGAYTARALCGMIYKVSILASVTSKDTHSRFRSDFCQLTTISNWILRSPCIIRRMDMELHLEANLRRPSRMSSLLVAFISLTIVVRMSVEIDFVGVW